MREIRSGVDVIVATPGRLIDLVERKTINFSELVATCIDEADQMLEKGFKLDIEEIFSLIQKHTKQKTQNLMFSATIPDWVDKISSQYMDISMKKINLISRS
jgi:superfamily II DNA/RNA helicase